MKSYERYFFDRIAIYFVPLDMKCFRFGIVLGTDNCLYLGFCAIGLSIDLYWEYEVFMLKTIGKILVKIGLFVSKEKTIGFLNNQMFKVFLSGNNSRKMNVFDKILNKIFTV